MLCACPLFTLSSEKLYSIQLLVNIEEFGCMFKIRGFSLEPILNLKSHLRENLICLKTHVLQSHQTYSKDILLSKVSLRFVD